VKRRYTRHVVRTVCTLLCVALAYGYAKAMVQGSFAWYDDEGFMLMTLVQYTSGVPLYDGMYTEYGPFYYVFHAALFELTGWPLTHDSMRWLTILSWLTVGVGWAAIVWAWSHSLRWSVAALFATMVLVQLNSEPGHPQVLIQMLLLGAFGLVTTYRKRPGRALFAMLGAVCAAVLLTKVNIGLFVLLSLAAVFMALRRAERKSRSLDAIVTAACLAVPAVLMHRHFPDPAVVLQCAVCTFGIGTLLYALRRHSSPEVDWSAVGWGAIGFFAVGSATITSVLLHGTSFVRLVDGVLLQPLRFSRAIPFQAAWVLVLVAALGCVLSAAVLIRDYRSPSGAFLDWLQPRIAFAIIMLAVFAPRSVPLLAPAVLWILVPRWGRATEASSDRLPAFVVISFAAFGVLIAYPVAGTQAHLAASFVMLGAFMGLLGGSSQPPGVGHGRPRISGESLRWSLVVVVPILIGIVQMVVYSLTLRADTRMPHSNLVQLRPELQATFEEIVTRTSRHCGTLVTIPGMNSFHIWSGLPHANGFIVSAAMVLFDTPAQERLKRDFATSRRPCVIFNPGLEHWSAVYRPHRTNQPFLDLVRHELVPVYSRSGYEIRVPAADVAGWRPVRGGVSN